ncbi:hypothetical protein KP729_004680|nr:hypothetical protein [Delftia acidovorans]
MFFNRARHCFFLGIVSYPQRCHASTTTTILYKKIKEQPKAKSRGKRRPNGFSKKQTCQVVWSLGMSRRGTAPAKLARLCSKKFRIGSRAMAVCTKTHEDKTSSRPRRNAVERALFHNGLCTGRGRLQETRFARRTQADAPEAVFGHSKKFNPLLPACKRTAHPDQEQQIQSRQGQSRKVMAAGAPGQEDVNQPERFSGLQRTVEAWQLSGPGLPAQARPERSTGLLEGSVGGYGRAGEQARSARSQMYPAGSGTVLQRHVGRCGSREIRLPTGCVQMACGQSAG